MRTYFGRCCYSSSSKPAGASSLPLTNIYMNELQQESGNSVKIDQNTRSNNRDKNELQQKFDNSSKIDQNTQPDSRNTTLFYRRKILFV